MHSISRTSSPRLSTRLVTRLLAHSIWLSLVLCHPSVHSSTRMLASFFIAPAFCRSILYDVWADWCLEDTRQSVSVLCWLAIGAMDGHGRSARHFGFSFAICVDALEFVKSSLGIESSCAGSTEFLAPATLVPKRHSTGSSSSARLFYSQHVRLVLFPTPG